MTQSPQAPSTAADKDAGKMQAKKAREEGRCYYHERESRYHSTVQSTERQNYDGSSVTTAIEYVL